MKTLLLASAALLALATHADAARFSAVNGGKLLQPERMVTVIVGATPADAGANAGSQGHGR